MRPAGPAEDRFVRSADFRPNWIIAGMVALCVATASAPVLPGVETASITGRVMSAASWSPVEGATVLAVDRGSGSLHRSSPTNDEGSFRLDGLVPGSYSLAVEVEQGAFLSESAIPLRGGETRLVKVAISRQEEPDAEPPSSGKKKKGGPWGNPVTATLIVIGGAIIVGVLVDKSTDGGEGPASPS
jgi:hypothetical protein